MLRSLLVFVFTGCVTMSAQVKDLQVSSAQAKFQPVTITATATLPADDELVKAMRTNEAMRPLKAVFYWGEQKPDKSLIYSEIPWVTGAMTASAQHVYIKPGNYGIVVTVTDTKGRLIIQRSISIKLNLPVEIQ